MTRDIIKEFDEFEQLYESATAYIDICRDVVKKAHNKNQNLEFVKEAERCMRKHKIITPGQLISLMDFIDEDRDIKTMKEPTVRKLTHDARGYKGRL